ncbi:putative secreted protein (Por secretion system target) [Chryseobacterium sp. 52]|uniref:T9SS type A sorting domain-containing protein n=1 Tax=Chryseobacterium sp. 52 TaxID=2035213 RepID=UPI000C18DCDC|nr:T9SS type A sorting domain-containing protein [Chryseobacterium sp. 52]PIF46726.1 putative secreted protein (Por secretion system target) [Chryseobacterium sp. 52]
MREIFIFLTVIFCTGSYAQIWTQTDKITPAERKVADFFGDNIVLKNNVLFSSASGNSFDSNEQNFLFKAGTFYIFERENNNWAQKAKIVPNDRDISDAFGSQFALDENDLFISAPYKKYNNQGSVGTVYLFNKNTSGNWIQTQKIMPVNTTANLAFGYRLSADSKKLAVGSTGANVAVYELNSTTQQFEFAQDLLFANNENSYESSVFVKGDKIFVGKKDKEVNGVSNAGQLNIYKKNSSTATWETIQTINSPLAGDTQFGSGVYAKDDYLFVTAHLASFVAVYKYSSSSNTYEYIQTIDDDPSLFGATVSMENGVLGIGAPAAMNGSLNSGSVFIYKINENNVWALDQQIYNADPFSFDGFGYGLSINNGRIAVGAIHQDFDFAGNHSVSNAGAVYLFNTPTNLATHEALSKGSYSIYPNPFTNIISIQLGKPYDHLTAEVFEMSGRKVLTSSFSKKQSIELNLESLVAGTYQIYIFSGDQMLISSKIIKK